MNIETAILSIDPQAEQFAALRWEDLKRIESLLTPEQRHELGLIAVEVFVRDGEHLDRIDPLASLRTAINAPY